jgi:hypothetical protein
LLDEVGLGKRFDATDLSREMTSSPFLSLGARQLQLAGKAIPDELEYGVLQMADAVRLAVNASNDVALALVTLEPRSKRGNSKAAFPIGAVHSRKTVAER